MDLSQILAWLADHAAQAWPIVSALLIIALRTRSPEEWIAMGETSPRWQGVIRLLRALGLDPVKALSALAQIVTGRAPVRAVQIADTIAPVDPSKVPAPIPREGERGTARVGTLLGLCLAILVACGLGAVLTGCPAIREGVMRVTPGVPDPSGCVEGTAACIATDAGMVPAQCDNTHRMWPTLPRRADGTRRTCVAECVVRDEPDAGQTARCVGPDGGAR